MCESSSGYPSEKIFESGFSYMLETTIDLLRNKLQIQMKEQVSNIMMDAIDVMNLSIVETQSTENKSTSNDFYSSAYENIIRSMDSQGIFGAYPLRENRNSSPSIFITGSDLLSLKSIPKNNHSKISEYQLSPDIIDLYNKINTDKYLPRNKLLSVLSIKDLSGPNMDSLALQSNTLLQCSNILLLLHLNHHYGGVLITRIDSILFAPLVDNVKVMTEILYVGCPCDDTSVYLKKVEEVIIKLAELKRSYSSEQMNDIKSHISRIKLKSVEDKLCPKFYSGESLLATSSKIMHFYQTKQTGDIVEFLTTNNFDLFGYHSFRIQIRLLVLNLALTYIKHFSEVVTFDSEVVIKLIAAIEVSVTDQKGVGICQPAKSIMDTLTDLGEVKAYGIVNGEFRLYLMNQNINYADCLVKVGLCLYDQYPRPEFEQTKIFRHITFSATKIGARFFMARCQLEEIKTGNREYILTCVAQTFCGLRRFFVYDKNVGQFCIFDESKMIRYKCDPTTEASIDLDWFIHYLKSTGVFYVGNRKRNSDLEESTDGPDVLNDGDIDSDDMKAEGGGDPIRLKQYLSKLGLQGGSVHGRKSARIRKPIDLLTPEITKKTKHDKQKSEIATQGTTKIVSLKQSKVKNRSCKRKNVLKLLDNDTDESVQSPQPKQKSAPLKKLGTVSNIDVVKKITVINLPVAATGKKMEDVSLKNDTDNSQRDKETFNDSLVTPSSDSNAYDNNSNPENYFEDSNISSALTMPQLSNMNHNSCQNSIRESAQTSLSNNNQNVPKHQAIVDWLLDNGFSTEAANKICAKMQTVNVDNVTRLSIRLKAMPSFLDSLGLDFHDLVDLKVLLECHHNPVESQEVSSTTDKHGSVKDKLHSHDSTTKSKPPLDPNINNAAYRVKHTSHNQQNMAQDMHTHVDKRSSSNCKISARGASITQQHNNINNDPWNENYYWHQNRKRGYDSIRINSYDNDYNSNQRHHPIESRRYSHQDPTNYDLQQPNHMNFSTQSQSQIILNVENQYLNLRLRQSERERMMEMRKGDEEEFLRNLRNFNK